MPTETMRSNFSGDVAIVLQSKLDPIRKSGLTCASGRYSELLFG